MQMYSTFVHVLVEIIYIYGRMNISEGVMYYG